METVEDCIQNFYVLLEETRRHLVDRQQRRTSSGKNLEEEDVCFLHDSCDLLYAHVQKLWESAPLSIECGNDDGISNLHEQVLDRDNVWSAIIENCTLKAFQLVHEIFQNITMGQSSAANAESRVLDYSLPGQASIAQMLELTIRLAFESKSDKTSSTTTDDRHVSSNSDGQNNSPSTIRTIVEDYTAYQRHILRLRSKPSIAHVAKIRNAAASSKISVIELITMQNTHENEINDGDEQSKIMETSANNEENDDEEQKRFLTQPHAHAICQILGEASSLIDPLVQWKDGIIESPNPHILLDRKVRDTLLDVCHDTIMVLDQEAQTLATTVGNWFLLDYSPSSSTHVSPPCGNVKMLDKSIDEMAFICQVISLYCSFHSNITSLSSQTDGDGLRQHLQEQSLNYSTTETQLVDINLKRALHLAKPVEIIIGSNLFVPSIVEDAYFISTRAIERASETKCDKAFWTVSHFICELWSASLNNDNSLACSIFEALMKQMGCVVKGGAGNSNNNEMKGQGAGSSKLKNMNSSTSSFANALLNVLDQDTSPESATEGGAINKAPLSGPLTQKIDGQQVQIDTLFCTFNGIHAASSACVGLSELLASLQSDNEPEQVKETEKQERSNTTSKNSDKDVTSMIQFVEEELVSHSQSYTRLLKEQIANTISKQCGVVRDTLVPPPFIASLPSAPSLHRLYYYLSQEKYNLAALDFQSIEADGRDMEMLVPLRECNFIAQVRSLKCEDGVTICITKSISAQVVSLILGTILDQKKIFTDWGSLLLAKQIRMIENFFCGMILRNQENDINTISNTNATTIHGDEGFTDDLHMNSGGALGGNTGDILAQFQKLSQAITILQLEKPSDWAAFAYEVGDSEENNLTKDEIKKIMSLRVDFTREAIAKVCSD